MPLLAGLKVLLNPTFQVQEPPRPQPSAGQRRVEEGQSEPHYGEGGPSHALGFHPRCEIHPANTDPYFPSCQVTVNNNPFWLVQTNSLCSF